MLNFRKLIECENDFPAGFTDSTERPYGKLFYNIDNPDSHDSNHAIIFSLDADLGIVLKDITAFYEDKKLTPRVYQAYQPGEKEILRPFLREAGFEIMEWDNIYLFHLGKSRIKPNPEIAVKQVFSLDDDIIEMIHTDDESDRITKVLQRHLKSSCFHLLVGYVGAKAVTMGSINIMDGFTRVDDVLTHLKYRCCGYGRALIDYMIRYHSKISQNILYLYASNPVAIRLYKDAGFVDAGLNLEYWSAWRT